MGSKRRFLWSQVEGEGASLSSLLKKCEASLRKSREDIDHDLALAFERAKEAVAAFNAGDHENAKRLLNEGCDFEFAALADCDALGELSEALYPGEEF